MPRALYLVGDAKAYVSEGRFARVQGSAAWLVGHIARSTLFSAAPFFEAGLFLSPVSFFDLCPIGLILLQRFLGHVFGSSGDGWR